MNKKFVRIILFTVVILVVGYWQKGQSSLRGDRVDAVGNLEITYLGVPLVGPIFEVENFMPGDCTSRTVVVNNNALTSSLIAVRSDEEEDESNLSSVLSIVILEGATDLYGGTSATGTKHLNEFFSDSDAVNGVPLSTLAGNSSSTSYEFEVCFDEQAGNEFKETAVSFDLIFGEIIIPVELPDVCQDLEGIVSKKIEGSEYDDRIRGTTASELILAKGGNDRIYPGGGSDCVIAGDGNDRVSGSTGNDIIEGGNGDDRLEGGTGNDLIYGNQGSDVIRGGSGNDKIFSGEGRDTIKGGSGNDEIFGQEDDDNIRGGSGNDYLDGGSGFDKLRGDFGYDICVEGEILLSCES